MFVYIFNLPVEVKINMEVDTCAETGFHDIRSGIFKSGPVYLNQVRYSLREKTRADDRRCQTTDDDERQTANLQMGFLECQRIKY